MPARLTFRKSHRANRAGGLRHCPFHGRRPVAGLPDADDIAPPETHRDLDFVPPRPSPAKKRPRWPRPAREAAFKTHRRITNSEGAGVSAQQSHFSAPTRAVFAVLAPARATAFRSPIASLPGKNGEMQRDAWYSSDAQRGPTWPRLRSWVALRRAQRALSRRQSQDPHHAVPGAV